MKIIVKITSTLFLCISIVICGCKKKLSPPFPLNYTAKMGGVWHWSGFLIHVFVDRSVNPLVIYVDTSYVKDTFSVTIIDDKTITVPNILHDTTFDISINLFYSHDSTNTIIFGYGDNRLSYNYQSITMSYYAVMVKDTGVGTDEYDLYLHSP